jgi:steroid delta-isomerase-like uncharacterized protein
MSTIPELSHSIVFASSRDVRSRDAVLAANVALVLAHYEDTTNAKTLAHLEAHLAPDFTDHGPEGPRLLGRDGVRQHMMTTFTAFPDLHVAFEDIIAEGDRVVVRGTWTGTHSAPWLGVPATGRRVRFSGVVIWRVPDGRIAERWGQLDVHGLLGQLEAVHDAEVSR